MAVLWTSNQGIIMAGHEDYGQTVEVAMILEIAQALRGEFGNSIDAHPGGKGSEAGVVNRAFRASARHILRSIVPRDEELDGVLTWVLRRAAIRRLGEIGVDSRRAEILLDQEPGLDDAWLAYLALTPEPVIGDLLGDVHEDKCIGPSVPE